jgi:hypothetical protein
MWRRHVGERRVEGRQVNMVLTDCEILDEVLTRPLVGFDPGLSSKHFGRENERVVSGAANEPIIACSAIEDVVAGPPSRWSLPAPPNS